VWLSASLILMRCTLFWLVPLRTSGPTDHQAQNFFAVADGAPANELYGELQQADTEWLCAGGFVTETQVFYTITDDGKSVMCQVIHSSVGCVQFSVLGVSY
jgi:hypothetical protein